MKPLRSFEEVIERAKQSRTNTVAIAAAWDYEVLLAALDARQQDLANCILVGDQQKIEDNATRYNLDISGLEIVHTETAVEASLQAMKLVQEGHAQFAMKGKVETADFLRAAFDKEYGIRKEAYVSHVSVVEIPTIDRLLYIADAAVIVAPTLEQKIVIVQNAINVARALGVREPKAALLAATEMVNFKIPASIDAASLAKMADRGQIKGGIVDGPLALDNAISPEAAEIKGIKSPVAGYADVLITPDIEAGNILIKGLTYFAKGRFAGVVVGCRAPLCLVSRADPHYMKVISIALAAIISKEQL